MIETCKGGSGSGNYGHAGRPGLIGGSGEGVVDDAIRKIPKGDLEGLQFKMGDTRMGGEAEYNPTSDTITVSPDLNRKRFLDYGEYSKYRGKHPGDDNVVYARLAKNKFPEIKAKTECSKEYAAHVVAHEVGHHVFEKLSSEDREKAKSAVAKIDTYTVRSYRDYQREQSFERPGWMTSPGGFLNPENRLTREKFAEAYRQYVIGGKHSRLFEQTLKNRGKKSEKRLSDDFWKGIV